MTLSQGILSQAAHVGSHPVSLATAQSSVAVGKRMIHQQITRKIASQHGQLRSRPAPKLAAMCDHALLLPGKVGFMLACGNALCRIYACSSQDPNINQINSRLGATKSDSDIRL